MPGLVYPGIWGCLQPVVPNVLRVTSALYPFAVKEQLAIPQPLISADSILRVTFYNPTFLDTMRHIVPSIVGGALEITIAYKNANAGLDTMQHTVPFLTPGSMLEATIAYKTINTTDTLRAAKHSLSSGTLTVVIAFQTITTRDTLRPTKHVLSNASTLTTV
jgi:hypothetical protein